MTSMGRHKAPEEIAKLFERKRNLSKLFDNAPVAELAEHHYTKPQPIRCKWCGSADILKYGTRNGVQEYICMKCKRKFKAKDASYKMRTTVEQIGAALNTFYDGLSLNDVARHLAETYNNPVSKSTVYRWVVKYTLEAFKLLEPLMATVSDTWVVDETVVKVERGNLWFWDIIDEGTRFLLASHLSRTRAMGDVVIVMPFYGMNPEEKGELVHRFRKNEVRWLINNNHIPEDFVM